MEKLIKCKNCGEDLPQSYFTADCRYSNGYKPICRNCNKKYHKEKEQTAISIFVARDYKGLHLCSARPILVTSVSQHGQYEWQRDCLTHYPVELHNAIAKYAAKNNTPKMNDVIKLEITFNISKV